VPEFQFAPPTLQAEAIAEQVKTERIGRRIRKRWVVLTAGLLCILLVPIILGYMYARAVYYPTVASGDLVSLEIAEGSSVNQVAELLLNKRLIDQPQFFKLYLRLSGSQASIQAGKFEIPQHISISDLSQRLGIAMREQVTLRFTEGWRREEMAEYITSLHQKGEITFSGEEFSALALNPTSNLRQKLGNRLPAGASLQGFLFPDTYYIDRDATAEDVLAKMIDTYTKKISSQLQSEFAQVGLTEYEALILAAIVEREAFSSEERPIIARILLKRLQAGEVLGTDATLQYALGYSEEEGRWWKQGITMQDLELDSPYNTRKVSGLPPAPICNPGLETIKAVAKPADSPYWYYIHDSEGKVHYATTLDEHNANVAKYLK
jgi:UPF0755 protein